MTRRILCALILLAPALVVGMPGQPASAATEAGAARTAVSRILGEWNGSLFNLGTQHCPQINTGGDGNCWWWAANAWMALISYAEEHKGQPASRRIRKDLRSTYTTICGKSALYWGPCPTSPDQHGKDPFTINMKGNTYFDDIGWWEQMWLNAFKLTRSRVYLYLAEELWNYVTDNGYKYHRCGGIVQYHKSSGRRRIGVADAFANSLYLRNSAWLYSITGHSRYMTGNPHAGGAIRAAAWIRSNLIYRYGGPAMGTPGAEFMIADHAARDRKTGSCRPEGNRSWLQTQGEMVNAWTDMYAACKKYSKCPAAARYYNNLADELALSVTSDQLTAAGGWRFKHRAGQAEPTVDINGVLSEPCKPPKKHRWPYDCKVGDAIGGKHPYQPWLISKGMFERAIYCSNHNFGDPALRDFAATNAAYLANLPHFGFLWDSPGANAPVIFATQASVLDGLDASLGGSYSMC